MTKKSPAPAKRRISRKKKVAVATVALIGVGGAAFAYWTAGGGGTGSAGAASSIADVEILQTGTPTGMGPGVAAQDLKGTIKNDNTGPAHVNSITADISRVTSRTTGTTADGCDSSDFHINNPTTIAYDAAADDTTEWSGPSIEFVNKISNQDACKNVTVTIAYTVS
jgi:hypothetical protein